MFELILIVAASIAMGRFAEADRNEGLKWGLITFALCLVTMVIPIPFLRIGLALLISFVLMTVSKKTFY